MSGLRHFLLLLVTVADYLIENAVLWIDSLSSCNMRTDRNLGFMIECMHVQCIPRLCTQVVLGMITSSNGNIYRITGPLWGGSTGHRWIPSDAELWCFLWSEHLLWYWAILTLSFMVILLMLMKQPRRLWVGNVYILCSIPCVCGIVSNSSWQCDAYK